MVSYLDKKQMKIKIKNRTKSSRNFIILKLDISFRVELNAYQFYKNCFTQFLAGMKYNSMYVFSTIRFLAWRLLNNVLCGFPQKLFIHCKVQLHLGYAWKVAIVSLLAKERRIYILTSSGSFIKCSLDNFQDSNFRFLSSALATYKKFLILPMILFWLFQSNIRIMKLAH